MKKMITGISFLGILLSGASSAFAAHFTNEPVVACGTQITRTLSLGQDNEEVYMLQNFLYQTGYLSASPNGHFGPATRAAVKAFQRANGLRATGSVGQLTKEAVNEQLCDPSYLSGDVSYGYDAYTSSFGSTVVAPIDPFVKVVTPPNSTPLVYATPQNGIVTIGQQGILTPSLGTVPFSGSDVVSSFPSSFSSPLPVVAQPYSSSYSGNYNNSFTFPFEGGQSGSVAITSPVPNAVYKEGDTVVITWTTARMPSLTYRISLENSATGQSKVVGMTGAGNYSFVLTKALLDEVCAGPCNAGQFSSFRLVMSTPIQDQFGNVSTFKATIAPLTINRPLVVNGRVNLTSSKTSVASGESFKLYVNFPSTSWDGTLAANYQVRVKALCSPLVSVTVGGMACGNEYVVPTSQTQQYQQEVSATIVNPVNYAQEVIFQVNVLNILGQVVGGNEARVTVERAPLGW